MRDFIERGWRSREGLGSLEANGNLSSAGEERMARLVRTIEGEIVPRLVMTRISKVPGPAREQPSRPPDAADIAELVRLLLAHDVEVASGFIAAVRHRGAGLDTICLKLLAPAARQLGLLWENDECDFMQVTVGLCRLHQLLREISIEFRPEEDETEADRSVLLAPIPGEQHVFGIMVVAQFLRRARWDVWHEFPTTLGDILDVVRNNAFAIVGLSVACETRLADVAAIIGAIRCASRNRAVGILVGGPVMVAHPEFARSVGADATATDGLEAVVQAERLGNRLAPSH